MQWFKHCVKRYTPKCLSNVQRNGRLHDLLASLKNLEVAICGLQETHDSL
jgi:hypothetical protein